MSGPQSGSCGGKDVVLRMVPDIQHLTGRLARQLDYTGEERGGWLGYLPLTGHGECVNGQLQGTKQCPARVVWLPATQTRSPAARRPARVVRTSG
jgi:hypothetical protein